LGGVNHNFFKTLHYISSASERAFPGVWDEFLVSENSRCWNLKNQIPKRIRIEMSESVLGIVYVVLSRVAFFAASRSSFS